MSDASGPTFFVRAVATWTADDGAPQTDSLGRTRVATTRVGRMAAHTVAALPTLAELRRTRPSWIVATANGPLHAIVTALDNATDPLRAEAVAPDGAANELSARVGGIQAWVTIGAGPATVAMALFEAAAQLATGAEDVVVVFVESEAPPQLRPAVVYEPVAVALHLAADPGPADLAMLAGPDVLTIPVARASGPHVGNPAYAALALARAATAGESLTIALDDGTPPGEGTARAGGVAGTWCARIKAVDRAGL